MDELINKYECTSGEVRISDVKVIGNTMRHVDVEAHSDIDCSVIVNWKEQYVISSAQMKIKRITIWDFPLNSVK